MRNSLIQNWLATLALLFGLFAVTQPARADVLDDFIGLYSQIEAKAPAGAMPVSSAYLKDSRDYIRCIANGTDVLVCTDQYHDTGAGKDEADGTGIPSGFWRALDAYVAYRQGDYWGAAWALGEAAACVALQILAGNVDLCGLAEELYKIAKGLYAGAAAVLGFLEDFGEAVWDELSALAEGLCKGVGLCDEDGPPLYVLLLKNVYSPQVKKGVDAHESPDSAAYQALLDQLEDQAMVWTKNFYSSAFSAVPAGQREAFLEELEPFITKEIAIAEQGYNQAVDAAWTGDITGRVVPLQVQKRTAYLSQQLQPLAQQAAERFVQNNNDPVWWVKNHCVDAFTKNDIFGMVDRWIDQFRPEAEELNLKTNLDWCAESFWGANQYKFAEVFRNYIRSHVCTGGTNTIRCTSLSAFQTCSDLLGTVGQQDQCTVDVRQLGLEAAARIQSDFKARGSRIPCDVITRSGVASMMSNIPVKLQCTRPTQQAACDDTYQRFYGSLPVKVLECTLQETATYLELKAKVVAAVNTLKGALGAESLTIGGYGDPLLVLAQDGEVVESVGNYSQQDWGFGPPSTKPGFAYPFNVKKTIDGLSTPAVWHEGGMTRIDIPKDDKFGRLKGKLDPSSPIVNPVDKMRRVERLQAVEKAQISAPAPAGVQAPMQGQQQQVMSGKLPQGSQQPGGPKPLALKRGIQPTVKRPAPMAAKPDLVFSGMPSIGGQPGGWNGMISLDAARASGRHADGSCEFALAYPIRNAGAAPAGPFRITWSNRIAGGKNGSRFVQALAAGTMRNEQDGILLRPGVNRLNLVLDNQRQIDEVDEKNNQATLTVMLSGSCRRMPAAITAPSRKVAPALPTQRLRTPLPLRRQEGPSLRIDKQR